MIGNQHALSPLLLEAADLFSVSAIPLRNLVSVSIQLSWCGSRSN